MSFYSSLYIKNYWSSCPDLFCDNDQKYLLLTSWQSTVKAVYINVISYKEDIQEFRLASKKCHMLLP